jgi:hypothetical protein
MILIGGPIMCVVSLKNVNVICGMMFGGVHIPRG